MRPIGFSTGALARGDFRRALAVLREHRVGIVELSALRLEELEPLISAIPLLDLAGFKFVSIHAPSRFDQQSESRVLNLLSRRELSAYPVVVHPDVIFTPASWRQLGARLLIENMDKRKPVGRNVRELRRLFDLLPDARFCFDIGHARQIDPTMIESALLLQSFGERLAEVHISEVNTASRHDPISRNAASAFQSVARYIPTEIPIILEPLIDRGQSELEIEIQHAREALSIDSCTLI
ncbi:MAG: hypothetical protein JWO80_1217 [Bryobacterales bacterium]|nr:hypothetical protein [Bryobacterales bacterium]